MKIKQFLKRFRIRQYVPIKWRHLDNMYLINRRIDKHYRYMRKINQHNMRIIESRCQIALQILLICLFVLLTSCSNNKQVEWCKGDKVTFYHHKGYGKPIGHQQCKYEVIELNYNWDFMLNFEGKAPSEDFRYRKYRNMFQDCDKRRCRVASLSDKNYNWYKGEFEKDFGFRFPFPRY